MKNNSTLQLSKVWWQKEQPKGLEKAGKAFEDAIDRVTKANAALRTPSAKATEAMAEALSALEDAGKLVIARVKDLEKTAKGDKEALKDLSNTRTVMEKVLPKEIDARRQDLYAAEDSLEDEPADGDFASAEAHGRFLKRFAGKLKRGPMNFAIALGSKDPADLRLNLHKTKGGRALASQVKAAMPIKTFTFGVAGTEEVSERLGMEGEGARTLILHVEGRMIPALAKRTKLMLRAMGVSAFGRVRVFRDGAEVDAADDDTDLAVPDLDLKAEDDPEAEAAEPAPEAPAPALTQKDLVARLGVLAKAVGALTDQTRKAKLAKALGQAKTLVAGQKLAEAEKFLDVVDKQLGAVRFDTPKAEPADVVPFNAVPFAKARLLWGKTRAKLMREIKKLEEAIVLTCGPDLANDPELKEIVDQAGSLSARVARFDDGLEQVLDQIVNTEDGPTRETLKRAAVAKIDEYETILGEDFFKDVDSNNGFAEVQVAATADGALKALRETLLKAKV